MPADVNTAITTAITPTAIWGAVADIMPILAVLIPVSLGLYFLRKAVKGASKGKVKF